MNSITIAVFLVMFGIIIWMVNHHFEVLELCKLERELNEIEEENKDD